MTYNESVIVIAALIAWVGYQVAALRREQRQRHAELLQAQHREELDRELARLCPSVCGSLTVEDLRVWQDVFLRKHEYDQRLKNLVTVNPISDEPSDWVSIYLMYLRREGEEPNYSFPEPANEAEQGYLLAAYNATQSFVKLAKDQTVLTSSEINFLTYWAWREKLMNDFDGSWGRPSAVTESLLTMSFDASLEEYRTALFKDCENGRADGDESPL